MVMPLRVVFLGTPEFAIPTLNAILASAHRVVGVVTQPDRPRGRGQQTSDAPVKMRAKEAGLPVLQPSSLKDPEFGAALEAFAADIGVVAAYGKIIPETVIHQPKLGMINVHASILPRYRGAAPVHRAVIAGERETGVTIMRVVKALDAGPMLAIERRAIGPDETSEDVERALARLGAELLVKTLDRLAAGPVQEIPQDDADANYAARITKEDSAVDWSRDATAIHNQIRGLHPWPHAAAYVNGRRLILLRSRPLEDDRSASAAGTVTAAHGDRFLVATGNGTLQLLEVQLEGKRAMTARDFLAGNRIEPGSRLTSTP
jgi:methionyl-tRNA formyltransferase